MEEVGDGDGDKWTHVDSHKESELWLSAMKDCSEIVLFEGNKRSAIGDWAVAVHLYTVCTKAMWGVGAGSITITKLAI
jgi:hypothetical protein